MRSAGIRLIVPAAILALAGCTSDPKTQPIGAAAATPAVSWDGTYRGVVQITAVGSGIQRQWCETDPAMVVQVTGNALTYRMPHPNAPDNPTPVYSGSITRDGAFNIQLISGVMSGRIVGNHMSGAISGSVCTYSFSTDRS
jgi:hypothetical protein